MAEARGPTHLLDVCHQKFSEFLFNAEYKCWTWLQEIEEEALKMFGSNFSAEPELMPKTPSQRKHRKKKRSSLFQDETKELTRKRLSRRRSGIKTASFQRLSQSKKGLENFDVRITGLMSCMTNSAKETSAEGGALDTKGGQNTEIKGERDEEVNRIPGLFTPCSDDHLVHVAGAADTVWLANSSPVMPPSEKTEEEGDASRLRSTSSPKASLNGKAPCRVEEIPAQELINSLTQTEELFQELKDSAGTPTGSQSGRHLSNRVRKNKSVSLVEKYSLTNKRKSTVRKSLSRAMAKKKAAQDSSSTCSRVSSHSSLEVFMDDEASQHGPLLTQNAEFGETANTLEKMFCTLDTPSPVATCIVQSSPKPEMQQGEVHNKERLETEIMDFQVSGSEDSAQKNCTQKQLQSSQKQSYKQALDDMPSVQNMQDGKNSSHKTTFSPANKIIRPFKNFFQSMQKNQLLKPSGSPGKNSVKHSTPSRPATKGDFVEKQRQRLESLRKKQEAEQQRKQKVEEEKKRRLEEIKLKREERLRKAIQARERVEQMEEEKKKRIEQKLFQLEEKSEKVREEKAAEEKNRKKKSIKKMGEAEVRKQKLLPVEDEPKLHEQPEKWRTVGEIKKMLEHNKVKQEKGHHEQQGKERLMKPLDLAVVTEKEENVKEEQNPTPVEDQEKKTTHVEAVSAAYKLLNITAQKSAIGSSNQVNPQVKVAASLKINPNDYGMDLNSDDSTDDENEPRKPVPVWASGLQLNEAVTYQYYNPPDIKRLFGLILSPKLEDIFYKNKPRYFKRTSSAVWQSPPLPGTKPVLYASNSTKKY